jgi:radical SAM superfamily enzyme YgiQ (UPF0313 family)
LLFSSEQAALLIAKRIKERRPETLIVVGGPQANKDAGADRILRSGLVDYAAQGEGETLLAELLDAVESGRPVESCKGIMYLRNGVVIGTEPCPLISDLNALPFADYSDFDMLEYTDPGCIPVSLSRGCPNKCIFCYEMQYWKRFRFRKAESLVAEVAHLHKTLPTISWLWFHDSLINGHMGELKRFAQGLIDGNIATRWASQAVIRKEMTRDVLMLLRKSGCISLNYGLESASFSVMLKMGKVLARGADADQIVRDTFESGIDCILNFMFGFPGETEEDFQISLDFVRRNRNFITMVQPSPGFCDFYPGTSGFKEPEKYGISLREGSCHWTSKDGLNTYLTRMTRFERFLETVHDLGVKCSYPHRTLYMKDEIVARYHYSYGEYDAAIPHYEKLLQQSPGNEEYSRTLADCRNRLSASESAETKVPNVVHAHDRVVEDRVAQHVEQR